MGVRAEIADGPDAGSWLPLDGVDHPTNGIAGRFIKPAAICFALLTLAMRALGGWGHLADG